MTITVIKVVVNHIIKVVDKLVVLKFNLQNNKMFGIFNLN